MRTVLISATLMLTLVACSKSAPTSSNAAPAPGPAPQNSAPSADTVAPKLQELAGKGATNCGDIKTMNQDELTTASSCAMGAAKNKKPFFVKYDLPGMSVGIAGNAEGKLFSVQGHPAANAPAGAAEESKTEPCPSDLRIAQSGRVTCYPPGSFGMTSSGQGNPHASGGSMPPAGTASPHGGSFGKPPAGTPNPHAPAPAKSHESPK